MSNKLSEVLRVAIRDEILSSSMAAANARVAEETLVFVLKELSKLYPEATRATIDAAPEGWFSQIDKVKITSGSSGLQVKLPKKIRVMAKHRNWNGEANIEIEPSPKFFTLVEMEKTLRQEWCRLRGEVMGILRHYTTVASLIKGWPQIKDCVLKVMEVRKHKPTPANEKSIQEVNSSLGLKASA